MNQEKFEQIIEFHHQTIMKLSKEKDALQEKIDQLMLEFCPEEMTQEQIENWEQHQVVSTTPKIINSESLKQSFNDMLGKQKLMVTIPVFKCTSSNEVCQVGEVEEDLSSKQCCVVGLPDEA